MAPRTRTPKRLSTSRSELHAVLEESRRLGFLGPGPVEHHVEHARLYRRALEALAADGRSLLVADLGAGGGVPSLPLLVEGAEMSMVLVDASQRRVGFCLWAATELGLDDRVEVWCGRAEQFGHEPDRRQHFDAVIARAFGPPSTTLECSAPLLRTGGWCVLSEPPVRRQWPEDGLAELGLTQLPGWDGLAVFERTGDVDSRFPRSSKEQRRKPLFKL